MAKIKQKKLKPENFRYVTKKIIKNPMIYISNFFQHVTEIDYWLGDINQIVNAVSSSEMACSSVVENGYYCRLLIEQVEVAYIIYKQCDLKKHSRPLRFFKTRGEYYEYSFWGNYKIGNGVNPAETLSRFFSFQTLSEWYETLDHFWIYISQVRNEDNDRFGDRIIAIREMLIRLALAFYDIYKNEGLAIPLPDFVFIESDLKMESEKGE